MLPMAIPLFPFTGFQHVYGDRMARINAYKLQFKNKYLSSVKHCTKYFRVSNILFNHYKNNWLGTFMVSFAHMRKKEITDEIIYPMTHGQVAKTGWELKSDEYQS